MITTKTRHTFLELYPDFDGIRWSVCCREMQVRLAHGNHEAAIRILREFCAASSPSYATLDSPVGDVFSERLVMILDKVGCNTIRSIEKVSDQEFLAIPMCGENCVGVFRNTVKDVRAGRVQSIPGEEERLVDSDHFATASQATPEHRIYMYVLENGPQRPSAIATALGLTPLQVADAIPRSKRLCKKGATVVAS